MNLVGIENITPYDGVVEFKLYKYDDRIDLGDAKLFICDLKIIIMKVNSVYSERLGKTADALGLVSNLNSTLKNKSISDDIKDFIFNEVIEITEANLEKENIDLMFIES
ncbi:MAG: hypothetical protein ACRC3Y_08445 [Romboutsia sp.]|uniref:hypothetical protein n=1 Tax=Romboutsia sp. TaxID=1965302 RepID=UPI003F2FC203